MKPIVALSLGDAIAIRDILGNLDKKSDRAKQLEKDIDRQIKLAQGIAITKDQE
ncbi:hypothetical protein KQUDLBSD_CDS0026 [Staphylococcus phage PG-2021_40]